MVMREFDSTINLTTEGKLSLFFVGCGSAFSKADFQTNLFIIKNDSHILVDCGTLCPFALEKRFNTGISAVKNLLLTHPHADHIGGVEELALNSLYVKKSPLNIVISDEFKKSLWKNSLQGGLKYSENGKLGFDDYFVQIKPTKILNKPFEIFQTNISDINIKLFRTFHVTTKMNSLKKSQYSVGLIIDDKILYTSDMQFKPEVLNWILQNYDIQTIFHDCDVAGYAEGVHASYKQLCTLPAEIKSKMFLCHYNSASKKINPTNDGFAGFAQSGIYYDFD